MADSRPPVPGEEFDELRKDDFTPAEVTTADVAPANRGEFQASSTLKALWLLVEGASSFSMDQSGDWVVVATVSMVPTD